MTIIFLQNTLETFVYSGGKTGDCPMKSLQRTLFSHIPTPTLFLRDAKSNHGWSADWQDDTIV